MTFKVDRVAARHSSVTQLALMLLAWYPHCHWWASGARQGQPRGCGVGWAPAGKVEFLQIMCKQTDHLMSRVVVSRLGLAGWHSWRHRRGLNMRWELLLRAWLP